MEEVKWFIGGQAEAVNVPEGAKKLPYTSPWGKLNLSDEEKGKVFNAMRGALIQYGLMENGK